MYEFHISLFARNKYDFDRSIYRFNGNAVLVDFHAARIFAHKMNQQRDLINFPELAVKAGEINAMGLIDEILHVLVENYRRQVNPRIISEALDSLQATMSAGELDRILLQFTSQFPPMSVYLEGRTPQDFLEGSTSGVTHREIVLEEILMLWLSNANPAFGPYEELFDDQELRRNTQYETLINGLGDFLEEADPAPGGRYSLFQLLRLPALRHPESLLAQLEFLLSDFGAILGEYQLRLLRGMDLVREENKPGPTGRGPAVVIDFSNLTLGDLEYERYSADKDWMPHLVLIAKNAYVWLDQLSKKFGRGIHTLDQIPDEELAELAERGFNGLWLIGLWERSPASRTIKHMCGNPDAVESAYSLFDYTIAQKLGGDPAYENLRNRAAAKNIRLAADMVPNHTGIFSKWVLEHPDWYIHLDHSPYPNYSFNGTDLSLDRDIGIYLEDHYYSRTDAAVVFKRVDHRSGRTHYIYHGNDGTSMPWNDTAQLDYLHPEAREAVIQTILNVARKFSIIRFDAAMTLAKKHIQRLWYPEPGQGGAIPSRSEYAISRQRFNELMPKEFWREVVDRVAAEVPDTLLLAEAFWLMEGYFVRTLGMHRVYNSAYMNMLRDEKNAEYRLVIKNTIEFDPEILKRYVNFMNNPDEDTAISQFGKGGKYLGVCTMMSTMPGLPMFGHGQVEGFTEKYGMEYQRAYYDEVPDSHLVGQHMREIAPLLRKRYLFSGVEHFRLYDFFQQDGNVNEDVFAYSNRYEEERSLVLYHNRWAETQGTIRMSAAYAAKEGDDVRLEKQSLGDGLGLPHDPDMFVIFQDHITGLEYIHNCARIHDSGLRVGIGAFQYFVFWNFRTVKENEWGHYGMLDGFLNGRGVHNIEEIRQEIILQPVLGPFRELVNPGFFSWAFENGVGQAEEIHRQAVEKYSRLLDGIAGYALPGAEKSATLDTFDSFITNALGALGADGKKLELGDWAVLLSWAICRPLGLLAGPENDALRSRAWMDQWQLSKTIRDCLRQLGQDENLTDLLQALVGRQSPWFREKSYETLRSWLQNSEIARQMGVNRYQEVLWYNRPGLGEIIRWAGLLAQITGEWQTDHIETISEEIIVADESAEYRAAVLLANLDQTPSPTDAKVEPDKETQ